MFLSTASLRFYLRIMQKEVYKTCTPPSSTNIYKRISISCKISKILKDTQTHNILIMHLPSNLSIRLQLNCNPAQINTTI